MARVAESRAQDVSQASGDLRGHVPESRPGPSGRPARAHKADQEWTEPDSPRAGSGSYGLVMLGPQHRQDTEEEEERNQGPNFTRARDKNASVEYASV